MYTCNFKFSSSKGYVRANNNIGFSHAGYNYHNQSAQLKRIPHKNEYAIIQCDDLQQKVKLEITCVTHDVTEDVYIIEGTCV